jgi:hypothetical protein
VKLRQSLSSEEDRITYYFRTRADRDQLSHFDHRDASRGARSPAHPQQTQSEMHRHIFRAPKVEDPQLFEITRMFLSINLRLQL